LPQSEISFPDFQAYLQYLFFFILLKRLVERLAGRFGRDRSRDGKARKFPVAIVA
jgi:hypothetical protein